MHDQIRGLNVTAAWMLQRFCLPLASSTGIYSTFILWSHSWQPGEISDPLSHSEKSLVSFIWDLNRPGLELSRNKQRHISHNDAFLCSHTAILLLICSVAHCHKTGPWMMLQWRKKVSSPLLQPRHMFVKNLHLWLAEFRWEFLPPAL